MPHTTLCVEIVMDPSQTRSRTELRIVWLVCAAIPVLPLLLGGHAGYCHRPHAAMSGATRICFRVYAPDGTQLPASRFGLAESQLQSSGSPSQGSVSDNSNRRSGNTNPISSRVTRRLGQFPQLPFVVVLRQVIGDRDGRTVDILQARTWVVINPVSTVDPESIPSTACAG